MSLLDYKPSTAPFFFLNQKPSLSRLSQRSPGLCIPKLEEGSKGIFDYFLSLSFSWDLKLAANWLNPAHRHVFFGPMCLDCSCQHFNRKISHTKLQSWFVERMGRRRNSLLELRGSWAGALSHRVPVKVVQLVQTSLLAWFLEASELGVVVQSCLWDCPSLLIDKYNYIPVIRISWALFLHRHQAIKYDNCYVQRILNPWLESGIERQCKESINA